MDDRNIGGEELSRERLVAEVKELRRRLEETTYNASLAKDECDFYRNLLDVFPSPIWRAGADGKCDYFNERWLKFTGRSIERELGDGWVEGVHPDDRSRVQEDYYQFFRRRHSFRLDYRLLRRDGKYRDVIDVGAPFTDGTGIFKGYIGSIIDITDRIRIEDERKKALHSLQERVKELTTLYRTLEIFQAPDPVSVLLQNVVRLMPAGWQYPEVAAARIRLGDDEYRTDNFSESDTRQVATCQIDSGRCCSVEIVYLEERPQAYEGPFLKEERDLIDSIAKLLQSFINRRQYFEARSWLASIVDSTDDAIIGESLDGVITSWNYGAERLYGYKSVEVLDREVSILMPPDRHGDMPMILEKIRRGRSVEHYETVRITKGGRRLDISLTVSPIKDEAGKIIGAATIARDITERMRVQTELEDAKAQAELYLDLISHDINNMNQVGIGYLELALSTLDLQEIDQGFLKKPLDVLKNSSRLIESVRKLQKAKTGELKSKSFDLCSLLQELKDEFSGTDSGRIRIYFTPVQNCAVIANDLIRDVFSNLIDNAIKHSYPDRPLDVGIGLSLKTIGSEEFFVVSVEDNGPGITDDIKARLFSRFRRGDTTARGQGLGLYLVRSLIEDFGGRVWVEDRVRGDYTKGARFLVMLPSAD